MTAPPEVWRVRIRTYRDNALQSTDWSPATLRLAFHPAQARMVNLGHDFDVQGYELTALDSNTAEYSMGNVDKRMLLVSD